MPYDIYSDIDNYSTDPDRYIAVPFVPSDEAVVEHMLALANVGPNDLLYDLGSGDGRIVVTAAKDCNARGIGIDIDPVQIADAMEYAGWSGVECQVDFIEDNLFTADFSAATVVTLYLLQSINVQLRPRLLSELRPGTRIVSHAFDMGDWQADEWIKIGGITIYKWIVPAKVEGDWDWMDVNGATWRVELHQKYQEVTGTAWLEDKEVRIESADLSGDKLHLTLQDGENGPQHNFALKFSTGGLVSVRQS